MKNSKTKRLALNPQTIRTLSNKQLVTVQGGMMNPTYDGPSCSGDVSAGC